MNERVAKFRAKIEEYRKHTPYDGEQQTESRQTRYVTQEDLASAIPISREYLNRKLNGRDELKDTDVIGIIKALVKLECIVTIHQAKELLAIMNLHDLRPYYDWTSPPFNSLATDDDTVPKKPDTSVIRDASTNIIEEQTNHQVAHLWFSSLSSEIYYLLPDREQTLHQLIEALENPSGMPVQVIDGLGGMGKTALAVEVIRRVLERSLFDAVIGDSAKQEYLMGGRIIQVDEAVLDFYHLLDAILRQLNVWEALSFEQERKRQIIADLLNQHHYLLFVDNLETAENAESLVAQLRGLLGKSRAIITSRHKLHFDFLQSSSLHGLSISDTYFFLDEELKKQKGRAIPSEQYNGLYRVTGGAPLALKLIVAQTQFLDLNTIVKQLERAGGDLYPFIFYQSWNRLSSVARNLLVYIGRTVATDASWDELLGVTETESNLIDAIEQLTTYSLLDTAFATGYARYSIHQLTRQFITNDLPQLWSQQRLL